MSNKAPFCQYCGKRSELVDSSVIYGKEFNYGKMYRCAPCNAYVGCHKGGKGDEPLGTLANANLREMRKECHKLFDPLWQQKLIPSFGQGHRKAACLWLAKQLHIDLSECHIGMFDEELCTKALGHIDMMYAALTIKAMKDEGYEDG